MIWLVLGVVLWCAVHLLPGIAGAVKAGLVGKLGRNGYKGAFSLAVVASVALIVMGWRAAEYTPVYEPPEWGPHLTLLLMLLAMLLFVAANRATRIKRIIRHPQLTGVIVWAVAHLIANGDLRSLVLFGGLGLWALIEIPLLNARDGAWKKPDAPAIGVELLGIIIALAAVAVIVFLHPYFTGVSPLAFQRP